MSMPTMRQLADVTAPHPVSLRRAAIRAAIHERERLIARLADEVTVLGVERDALPAEETRADG